MSTNDDFDELAADAAGDEKYFEDPNKQGPRAFDSRLLREPLSVLPVRAPLVFSPKSSTTDAMRVMQAEHRGCVVITEDGSMKSRLTGIFTERDVLIRVIDRGRHPASVTLEEVMTNDPEALPATAPVAWVLNKMQVGGFRHVPAVDDAGRPVFVVSVRDVVQFLVEAFPEEVLNLPPEFGAPRYTTRDGA